MKKVFATILLALPALSFASIDTDGDANVFDCMDKQSFEINSFCMQKRIESNIAFKQVQSSIELAASDASQHAIATVTFYPKTFSIEVVAHKDALLAKTNN